MSLIIVCKSTTVGTPIAITGILSFFSDISLKELKTPLPGSIPVSVIWTTLHKLSIELDDKESITIINEGFILPTIPLIISKLSIPLSPKTEGAILDTLE